MSLELIKSPNYPFPVLGPPPPISVNAVAALSQVFYKVQRADSTLYGTIDSGGFLAIQQSPIAGAPQAGQFIHIAEDKGINGLGVIPTYAGSHLITQVLGIGAFKTSTPFTVVGTDEGIINYQDFDIVTIKAEVTTSAPELATYDQQYKIPYNHPVFNFDLKAGMNPSFHLKNDRYYTAQVVITGANKYGPETGSAIDTYDHQLFAANMLRGNTYGANLLGFVLRVAPYEGFLLTLFKEPEAYIGRDLPISYYVDQDYSPDDIRFHGNWYDINHNIVAAINVVQTIPFDGFGIKVIQVDLDIIIPATAEYLLCYLSQDDVGNTPLTDKKFYRLRAQCDGEVMMAWVNRWGGTDIWAMSIQNEASIESKQGLKYVVGGVTDLARNINSSRVLPGEALQNYVISETGLTKGQLASMSDILRSPLVEILTYNQVEDQFARVEVDVISGFSTAYNQGSAGQFDFQCTIQLPNDSNLLENLVTYPI